MIMEMIGEDSGAALDDLDAGREDALEHLEGVQVLVAVGMLNEADVFVEGVALHDVSDLEGEALGMLGRDS